MIVLMKPIKCSFRIAFVCCMHCTVLVHTYSILLCTGSDAQGGGGMLVQRDRELICPLTSGKRKNPRKCPIPVSGKIPYIWFKPAPVLHIWYSVCFTMNCWEKIRKGKKLYYSVLLYVRCMYCTIYQTPTLCTVCVFSWKYASYVGFAGLSSDI
jgi:hypothetical protein